MSKEDAGTNAKLISSKCDVKPEPARAKGASLKENNIVAQRIYDFRKYNSKSKNITDHKCRS